MSVITEFYMTRSDGVKLYHTYSDADKMLVRNDGIEYSEAIDIENSGFTYTENEHLTEDSKEISAEELLRMVEGVL